MSNVDWSRKVWGIWVNLFAAPLDVDSAAIEEIREITALVDLPGFDYDTDQEKLDVDKELSAEFFSRRIYETLPNPYLAAQVVKRMLDTLHRQGYTDENIFDRRYHLSEILKRRLADLVEHEAQTVFHRKLQNQADTTA